MLPILLLASFLGFVGYKLGTSHDRKIRPISFGAVPGAMRAARNLPQPQAPTRPPTPYLDFMTRIVAAGNVPNQQVVDAAYGEAYQLGDWATVQTIEALVTQWTQQAVLAQRTQAPQEQVVAGAEEAPGDIDLSDYESANPASGPAHAPVAPVAAEGTPINTSPINGVTVDEWCQLVRALKTRTPDYSTDNHLGAWEHNRRRLRALGLGEETLATEAGQYQALVTDVSDYLKTGSKVIENFCGDVVDIDGVATPVTLSGVLCLLKTAGPRGAEGWLRSPEDRKAFPQTTAAFVRCNGHF